MAHRTRPSTAMLSSSLRGYVTHYAIRAEDPPEPARALPGAEAGSHKNVT